MQVHYRDEGWTVRVSDPRQQFLMNIHLNVDKNSSWSSKKCAIHKCQKNINLHSLMLMQTSQIKAFWRLLRHLILGIREQLLHSNIIKSNLIGLNTNMKTCLIYLSGNIKANYHNLSFKYQIDKTGCNLTKNPTMRHLLWVYSLL